MVSKGSVITHLITKGYWAPALSAMVTSALAGPVDDLQPGHWFEVPNSQLLDVTPAQVPPGIEGYPAIMDSWSGGAYDTARDRLIVWGGGHAAYSGNEVYVFDTTNGAVKKLAVKSEPHGLTVWPQPGRYSLGHTGNMR